MKVKRLITLTLVPLLLGSATVFAGSLWGEYEGYSKIKLMVNGEERTFNKAEVPPFLVDGSAVVPVDGLENVWQALVKWDKPSMTLSVYKPDVHMFVARDVSTDYSIKQTFGKVKKGEKIGFVVFAQVDNLKTNIHSFKISIVSPSGQQVGEPHIGTLPERKESFWYPWPFNVTFDEAGKYIVKFSIKLDEASDYTVVSEKEIVAVSE